MVHVPLATLPRICGTDIGAGLNGPRGLVADEHPDLLEMRARFYDRGWDWVIAHDMDVVYERLITQAERQRVARIEMFDEFEEWHLLMQHYCLVFATVDRIAAAEDSAEENWVRRLGCHLEIS